MSYESSCTLFTHRYTCLGQRTTNKHHLYGYIAQYALHMIITTRTNQGPGSRERVQKRSKTVPYSLQGHITLPQTTWQIQTNIRLKGWKDTQSRVLIWSFFVTLIASTDTYLTLKTHPKICGIPLYDTWLDSSDLEESNHILGHVIWSYGPFIIQKRPLQSNLGHFFLWNSSCLGTVT